MCRKVVYSAAKERSIFWSNNCKKKRKQNDNSCTLHVLYTLKSFSCVLNTSERYHTKQNYTTEECK